MWRTEVLPRPSTSCLLADSNTASLSLLVPLLLPLLLLLPLPLPLPLPLLLLLLLLRSLVLLFPHCMQQQDQLHEQVAIQGMAASDVLSGLPQMLCL